jgi:hypothetical protein
MSPVRCCMWTAARTRANGKAMISTNTAETRMRSLGIEIPEVPKPLGGYKLLDAPEHGQHVPKISIRPSSWEIAHGRTSRRAPATGGSRQSMHGPVIHVPPLGMRNPRRKVTRNYGCLVDSALASWTTERSASAFFQKASRSSSRKDFSPPFKAGKLTSPPGHVNGRSRANRDVPTRFCSLTPVISAHLSDSMGEWRLFWKSIVYRSILVRSARYAT